MKNTLLSPVVIASLLLLGVGVVATVRFVYHSNSTNQQAGPTPVNVSVFSVLQAHSFRHTERMSFTQKATFIRYAEDSGRPQRVAEKSLTLSVDHSFVRFDKTTDDSTQSYLFLGQTLVRTTHRAGTQQEVKIVDVAEADNIRVQVETFGLAMILRRVSEPDRQVVFLGASSKGNRFEVKATGGSLYFYTNTNDVIDRLEFDDISISYGDYRTVDGLNLPFYQQVRKGDRLLYEIRFDTIDFNPTFAPGFFKSDLL